MTVQFSKLAAFKLEMLTAYLEESWSTATSIKFLEILHAKLKVIQSNPFACPESKLSAGLRKCVVTKHTTLLYEVHTEHIYVLNIIDTRQDPNRMKDEIEKHFG